MLLFIMVHSRLVRCLVPPCVTRWLQCLAHHFRLSRRIQWQTRGNTTTTIRRIDRVAAPNPGNHGLPHPTHEIHTGIPCRRHRADLCVQCLDVELDYTTTHFSVLGQTRSGKPSRPSTHTSERSTLLCCFDLERGNCGMRIHYAIHQHTAASLPHSTHEINSTSTPTLRSIQCL